MGFELLPIIPPHSRSLSGHSKLKIQYLVLSCNYFPNRAGSLQQQPRKLEYSVFPTINYIIMHLLQIGI